MYQHKTYSHLQNIPDWILKLDMARKMTANMKTSDQVLTLDITRFQLVISQVYN